MKCPRCRKGLLRRINRDPRLGDDNLFDYGQHVGKVAMYVCESCDSFGLIEPDQIDHPDPVSGYWWDGYAEVIKRGEALIKAGRVS